MRWNYLSIPKIQRCNGWCLGWISNLIIMLGFKLIRAFKGVQELGKNMTNADSTRFCSSSGPVFYLTLSKVSANERRHYMCNVFFRWLRPCPAIEGPRVPIHWRFFHRNSAKTLLLHNSVHASTVKVRCDPFNKIWMRAKWNFHRIRITIKKMATEIVPLGEAFYWHGLT